MVIVDRLDIGAEEFQEATGWEIKPEGACKAEVCVPLADGPASTCWRRRSAWAWPSCPSPASGRWGRRRSAGRALTTADASDFHLPDLDGNEFRITLAAGPEGPRRLLGSRTEAVAGTCPGGRH